MTKIKPLTLQDLDQIVCCHMNCFPKTFLSSLGKKIISGYYETCLKQNSDFTFGLFDEDKLIGFVYGYLKNNQESPANCFAKQNRVKIFFAMLGQCFLLNRVVYKKIWNIIFSKKTKTQKEILESKNQIEGDLLSICLLPKYRGNGLSNQLLHKYESSLIANKIYLYQLSVRKNNVAANKFYLKNGMKNVAELEDSYIYRKELIK